MRGSLDGRELLKEMESLADELDSMEFDLGELKEELEELTAEFDEYESDGDAEGMKQVHDSINEKEKDIADSELEIEEWKTENAERLKALQDLSDEINLKDALLIHEDDFTDYVQDFASDCGLTEACGWLVIDWDATANAIMMDYTSVDFDGESYLVRE